MDIRGYEWISEISEGISGVSEGISGVSEGISGVSEGTRSNKYPLFQTKPGELCAATQGNLQPDVLAQAQVHPGLAVLNFRDILFFHVERSPLVTGLVAV